jgi:integrase
MNFPITKHSKKFWVDRVYKPEIHRRDGTKTVSDNYAVRLHHAGKEARLSLGTPNQEEAASIARDWFVYLSANGWPAFLAKYRNPEPPRPPVAESSVILQRDNPVTVGEFLAAVRTESDLAHKTVDGYARAFRLIVSEVRSIAKGKKRFDYRKGGLKVWLARVDAMPLSELTPERIRAWKRVYIARAGHDELARRRYTTSCNSYLRQSRALFSKGKVLDKLRSVKLPDVLPFNGVELEPRIDTKFYGAGPGVEPLALVREAVSELGKDHPEELKAFLLAITCGLRRREIDLLEWQSFDFVNATVRIQPTKWYSLKTNESAGELPVEPEILELFRGWRARAKTEFVIESDRPPKAVSYQHYRCEETFAFLLAWLRTKGVQGNKPLHVMRKLYGSAVCDLHGLHAASSALRHADLRTTSSFYVDRRVRVTPGFGSALSGAEVVPLPKPSESGGPQRQPRKRAGKNL